jgi:hypothetical protein
MTPTYWHQRASTWVSAAVLMGGVATALICVMLFRIQTRADATDYLGESLTTASRAYLPE